MKIAVLSPSYMVYREYCFDLLKSGRPGKFNNSTGKLSLESKTLYFIGDIENMRGMLFDHYIALNGAYSAVELNVFERLKEIDCTYYEEEI